MGMKINAELPLPADLKAEYPLSDNIVKIKEKRDREIRDIFTGKSDKFVVIVGPCSADNEDSVCEYVNRLAEVNEKVSDRLMIIPRIYTNKPEKGTKECSISRSLIRRRIFWQELSLSGKCTPGRSKRAA